MSTPVLRAAILAACIFAACTLSACNGPLVFPDWTVEVPEGIPIHEYAGVPRGERSETIELIEDMVIGERGSDSNYRLYNAAGPKVDADGNLYVLDAGNFRVQVFDRDGDYIRTFGGQGQGPGEFTRPRGLVLAGNRVAVVDAGNHRFSAWTLDGDRLDDIGVESRYAPSRMFGFNDGTLLGSFIGRGDEDPSGFSDYGVRYHLVTYGTDFKELAAIQEFPPSRRPSITRRTETSVSEMSVMLPTPTPSHAAARTGEIYTSLSEEYQVHAFAHDGTQRWALRVAWERSPITEEEIVEALDRARLRLPDARRSEVEIPAHKPAVSYIAVDGHGHLYVFPYPEDPAAERRPVDVYSRDGEALFSGWILAMRWSDARDDFVYDWESDDDSGEERVTRYRLVEPFDQGH